MATFLELHDNIVALTHRADLSALIKRKINAVVRNISATGLYQRDLYEVIEAPDLDDLAPILDLPDNTRRVAYVKDGANSDVVINNRTLHYLAQNPLESDCYYVSGNKLMLRLTVATTSILYGVYRYPALLVADADTNWLLEDLPDLVENYVTAWVHTLTGNKEIAADIQRFAGQELNILVSDRGFDSIEAAS